MRLSRAVRGLALTLFMAVLSSAGCQNPTQLGLALSTDIPCGSLHSIRIDVAPTVAAAEANIRSGKESIVSTVCTPDGTLGIADLGSLYVFPGDDPSKGAIVVRAGVKPSDTQNCIPPLYKGCVVAKRSFQFLAQDTILLPVRLPLDCLDFPCSSEQTCIAKNVCAPNTIATIPDLPRREGDAGSRVDASPLDGTVTVDDTGTSTPGDAATDAMTSDAADALADATTKDASDATSDGSVKDGAIATDAAQVVVQN